jgi:hypothetical protein
MPNGFDLAKSILSQEYAQEAARRAYRAADVANSRRAPSGMGYVPPSRRRSDAEIRHDAERKTAERTTFRETPKGRLNLAIGQIEADPDLAKYAGKAVDLRGLYCRSVSMEDGPISREVCGALIALFNGIPGQAARDGVDAVAEMLMREAA